MPILVTCECGRTLRANDAQAGRQCRCPACGIILVVPLPPPVQVIEAPVVVETEPAVVLGYAHDETVGRADPLVHGEEMPIPVIAPPSEEVAKLERTWRGNLWWIFLLMLLPLALMTFLPPPNIQQRIERTLVDHPQLRDVFEIQVAGNYPDLPSALDQLPAKKLHGALLRHSSVFHWLFAIVAAAIFLPLVTRALPVGGGAAMTLKRAALAALFTGTAGVLLLISLQLARFLCCVNIFYYAALDPAAPFGASLIGFVFGVGACEEIIKCLPILYRMYNGTLLNWREACLIGMASGVGFGLSEAILYAGRYNGVEGYEIYLVRFLSAVTLHILLSGACAILIQRKQEHLLARGIDPINWLLTLLAIIIVPVFLHGLFNAFAKQEMTAGCLVVAVASFAWLAVLIRSSRAREMLVSAAIDEGPKVIRTERGTRWVAPPEPHRSRRSRR